ncbi:unknown [Fusobacterium nucleatum subsp. nucleatum ATCC 25586]|uniref:Uncharacterized protein n=1 Tax=Fusobacterium nucleatum subsp. nucleatum (strain ATCC 25586 / DSM 15643 / BCRC 10681 / CIP 101130 / JCM 8532 / KCTC 2640 / LMG 13131 / VPI 4355) TaxID=190304 RepID=Q8RDV4_FUSNN|nr:unknown [Fusobacterium nucleatum subsp. nucleatum ATCC 25586]
MNIYIIYFFILILFILLIKHFNILCLTFQNLFCIIDTITVCYLKNVFTYRLILEQI